MRARRTTTAPRSRRLTLVACAVAFLAASGFLFPAIASAAAIVTPAGYDANAIARGDDTSNLVVNLPFSMNWAGTAYTQVYLNMNGNVTFGSAFASYDPNPTLASLNRAIMAPFWADVDTRNTSAAQMTYSNITSGSVPTVGGHKAFLVNWIGVSRYNSQATPLDSFQLVLIDRSDTGAGNFDFEYNYDTIAWDFPTASSNGYARAGWARADGTSYELPGGDTSGRLLDTGANALIDGTLNAGGVLGRYVWQVRNGTPGNSSPVISLAFTTTTLQANTGAPTPGLTGYSGAGDATASDPDGSVASFVRTPAAGAFLPMGSSVVTWTATDNLGAVAVATQTINVVDDTPPSLPSLSSPTHSVSTWSTLSTIGIEWTDSVDANTGVAGYSYSWTANAAGLPDTSMDAYTPSTVMPPTLENQSFPSATWPADLVRGGANPTFLVANNGRNHGTYAAEVYTNVNNTRKTAQFTKTYDLSGYTSATLSFWDYATFSGAGDFEMVEYSTNGSTWTTLKNTTAGATYAWAPRTYPIPTGSSTVTLRFSGSVNRNTEFVDWDDISLTAVGGTLNTITNDSGDGRWYFNIRAVNGAGTWTPTAASIGPFWIDRAAPTTTSNLAATWLNAPPTVALSASDGTGSGVASTTYKLDGGGWTPYATPFSVMAEGSHTLSYRSADALGNQEPTRSVTFGIDTSLPSTPTSVTASAASTTSVDVSWPASTDAVSGVAYYAVYRDGSLVATTTATSYTVAGLTPGGSYSFTIRAVDAAGNSSAQSAPATESVPDAALSLDISSPDVSFVDLLPGLPETRPDATTVSVSGVGVVGYQLSCAAADLSDVDTASPAPSIPVSAMSFATHGWCTSPERAFSASPVVVNTSTGVDHRWTHDYVFDYTMTVSWAAEPGSYETNVVYTVVSN